MKALALVVVFALAGCATRPVPVKVQIKEVPVEVIVPIPAQLTAPVPAPARPANRCTDDQKRPTLCNRDLGDWLIQYDGALGKANSKLRAIMGLQK